MNLLRRTRPEVLDRLRRVSTIAGQLLLVIVVLLAVSDLAWLFPQPLLRG